MRSSFSIQRLGLWTATIAIVAAALLVSGAASAEEPAVDKGKLLCDHLATHASDYDDEDKAECPTAVVELFASFTDEQIDTIVACALKHEPISQDQFGECLMATLKEGGVKNHPPAQKKAADPHAGMKGHPPVKGATDPHAGMKKHPPVKK